MTLRCTRSTSTRKLSCRVQRPQAAGRCAVWVVCRRSDTTRKTDSKFMGHKYGISACCYLSSLWCVTVRVSGRLNSRVLRDESRAETQTLRLSESSVFTRARWGGSGHLRGAVITSAFGDYFLRWVARISAFSHRQSSSRTLVS